MRETLRSRIVVAAAPLVMASVVAGCSQTESGSASPETNQPPASVPGSSESATESGSSFSSSDLCSLLASEDIAQYGEFRDPVERTYQGNPICSWRAEKDGVSDVEAPLVDLIYRDGSSIQELQDLGNGIKTGRTQNSGRELALTSGMEPVTETPSCVIAMDLGDGSRLDVGAGRTAEPCELVENLVEIVDPKLPRG